MGQSNRLIFSISCIASFQRKAPTKKSAKSVPETKQQKQASRQKEKCEISHCGGKVRKFLLKS
jgi:hypothetical protein